MKKSIIVIVLSLCIILTSIPVVNDKNTLMEKVESKNIFRNSAQGEEMEDWYMFHKDLSHMGYIQSSLPEVNKTLWIYNTGSSIRWSSPAIVDNELFTGALNGKVYCLDAETGNLKWIFQIGGAIWSSPAVVNGALYVGSYDGKLYSIDTETGEMNWNYNTSSLIKTSPAVSNDFVYFGTNNKKIYCLYSSNGTKKWSIATSTNWDVSSPAIYNDKVYMGGNCYYTANGSLNEQWEHSSGSFQMASPSIFDDRVIIGDDTYNRIYCLNSENGSIIWEFPTTNMIASTAAIHNNKIFIGGLNSKLYCINFSNGQEIWNYQTDSVIYTSPAVSDGKVYFGSWGAYPNKFYCIDESDGSEIWSYKTVSGIESSPAIYNNKVYVASNDGKIYCFGNNPPDSSEIISGPSKGNINVSYLFIARQIEDPDGDDVFYKFDWGDGQTSEWLESHSTTHIWYDEGIYEIKVKTKDEYGAESDWSESFYINITQLLPQLIINAPSKILEDEDFTVTITSGSNYIEFVEVTFNDETKTTDVNGQVSFTAPSIDINKDYYITAYLEGYSSDSKLITILKKDESYGWIFGVVYNSEGILLNQVKICAQLIDEENNVCTFSDDEGRYVIKLPVGTYLVKAALEGYEDILETVNVLEKNAKEINFVFEITQIVTPPDKNREKIDDAIKDGKIGGEIVISKGKYNQIVYYDLSIDITKLIKNEIQFDISSEQKTGTVIVITLSDESIIKLKSDDIEILYDGGKIYLAPDLDYVLNAGMDDPPSYYILGNMLVLNIPEFSLHTITIKQIIVVASIFILLLLYFIVIATGSSIFIYPYIAWPYRVRKGKRKKL